MLVPQQLSKTKITVLTSVVLGLVVITAIALITTYGSGPAIIQSFGTTPTAAVMTVETVIDQTVFNSAQFAQLRSTGLLPVMAGPTPNVSPFTQIDYSAIATTTTGIPITLQPQL